MTSPNVVNCKFVEAVADTDGDASDTRAATGRTVSGKVRWMAAPVVLTFVLALVAIVAFGAHRASPMPLDEKATISAASKSKPVMVFKQCGGEGWKGSSCCQKGCACIRESKYYSGCHAPQGLTGCDTDALEDEVGSASGKVDEAKEAADEAEAEVKHAKHRLAKAKSEHKDAHEAAQKAINLAWRRRKR